MSELTASVRERLVRQVVAALGADGKPAGLTVHRQRTLPLEDDDLPATVVYVLDEALPPERQQHGSRGRQLARRALRLVLEHRAAVDPAAGSGAATQAVDEALDPFVTWGVRALLADPRLGGLAIGVLELETQWRVSDTDDVRGAAATLFHIDYLTAAADPTARA
jgi:hypothetical protein